MFKLMSLSLSLMFLVVTGCGQDTTTKPVAGRGGSQMSQLSNPHDFEFAMLDDFAVETTGANGSGLTDVEGGSVEVEVEADGLIPGHVVFPSSTTTLKETTPWAIPEADEQ